MKLKSKFLLLILPMIVLPLVVVNALSYQYLKEVIHRFANTQLDSSLLQVSSDTTAGLNNAASSVTLLS